MHTSEVLRVLKTEVENIDCYKGPLKCCQIGEEKANNRLAFFVVISFFRTCQEVHVNEIGYQVLQGQRQSLGRIKKRGGGGDKDTDSNRVKESH